MQIVYYIEIELKLHKLEIPKNFVVNSWKKKMKIYILLNQNLF